jgi:hypothetical protein
LHQQIQVFCTLSGIYKCRGEKIISDPLVWCRSDWHNNPCTFFLNVLALHCEMIVRRTLPEYLNDNSVSSKQRFFSSRVQPWNVSHAQPQWEWAQDHPETSHHFQAISKSYCVVNLMLDNSGKRIFVLQFLAPLNAHTTVNSFHFQAE